MSDTPRPPPPKSREPIRGTVVAGAYELEAVIGQGGMGTVWRARQLQSDREVALKLVGESLLEDVGSRRRFEREAKLLARLGRASAHVVRVLDHGVTPEQGPFLAMELLTGQTLKARLESRERLSAREVVRIVSELCQALRVAHAAGVVHRDVKPANVFLHRPTPDAIEVVKLLDFGVAKSRIDDDQSVLTRAGSLIGTPHYMSPEQLLGDTALDARADLWSVGVLVYRMLVGWAPFARGPTAELAARILAQEPPAPSSVIPGLPSELDAWVKTALAKRVTDRFADAASMAGALQTALAKLSEDTLPTLSIPGLKRERHAKGVNLIDLVKLIRKARRNGLLTDLSAADLVLVDERVLVSSWYPIEAFWRLLELAHERVLGGSEDNTVQLGVAGAESVMGGVHSVYVSGHEVERALRGFERGWSSYFDFGSVEARLDGNLARITIHGYPDMPRAHGLTTLGWFRATLALVGAKLRYAKITSAPWNGADAYVLELGLDGHSASG